MKQHSLLIVVVILFANRTPRKCRPTAAAETAPRRRAAAGDKSLARPGVRPARTRAPAAGPVLAREERPSAAGDCLDSWRRLARGQQGQLSGGVVRRSRLRRGQYQLPVEPARGFSRPDRGLQGSDPLAPGQRQEVRAGTGAHRRLGRLGGRPSRRPAGHLGGREGTGGQRAATWTSPAACRPSWTGSARPTLRRWPAGTTTPSRPSRCCWADRSRRTRRRRRRPTPSPTCPKARRPSSSCTAIATRRCRSTRASCWPRP